MIARVGGLYEGSYAAIDEDAEEMKGGAFCGELKMQSIRVAGDGPCFLVFPTNDERQNENWDSADEGLTTTLTIMLHGHRRSTRHVRGSMS